MSSTTRKSGKREGPKELLSRFGFHSSPFSREFQIERRFELPHLEEALESLHQAVLMRESAALIAPAGSGKTVILRALRSRLPEARYRVRYVKVTGLSRRDMCREIAYAMDIPPAGQFPALVRSLQERLRAVEADGLRPVLILDEAQDMRAETLGLLKIITNFDMLCAAAHNISCAESTIVRSTAAKAPLAGSSPTCCSAYQTSRSMAISRSGGENVPGRKLGGTTASSISSFSSGSAWR